MRRWAGLLAICCLVLSACQESDRTEPATGEARACLTAVL